MPEFLKRFHDCPYVVGVDIFSVDNIPDDKDECFKLVDRLTFLLKVEASVPEKPPYSDEMMDELIEMKIQGLQENRLKVVK